MSTEETRRSRAVRNEAAPKRGRIIVFVYPGDRDEEEPAILIDGTPATTYTVERDYCFGMGDSRYNSEESRFWGFIPYENVVGTPTLVYWSIDQGLDEEGLPTDEPSRTRWERIGTSIE